MIKDLFDNRFSRKYPYLLIFSLCLILIFFQPVHAQKAKDEAIIHPGGGSLISWHISGNYANPIWVGQGFRLEVFADFGRMKREMVWDYQGYLSGAYTEEMRNNVPFEGPFNVTVQRLGDDLKTWSIAPPNTYSAKSATGYVFNEQGVYRFKVVLDPKYPVMFPRQTPCYSNQLLVYDRKYNRTHAICDVNIEPHGGIIDGRNNPQFCQTRVDFIAKARSAEIQWESNLQQMRKNEGPWRNFPEAVWTLKTEQGEILRTKTGKTIDDYLFDFNPREFGDGHYSLEAALPEHLQGQGLQNFKTRPSQRTIWVTGCGEGSYSQTQEGIEKKKKAKQEEEAEVSEEDLEGIELNGLNKQGEPVKVKFVKPAEVKPAPPPPKDVPAQLDNCPHVEKQILERMEKLQRPCAPCIQLMKAIIATPKEYAGKATEFKTLWNGMVGKIDASYKPLKELIAKHKAFIQKAVSANAIIPSNVLAQERRRSSFGSSPIIGNGYPVGMFELNPERIGMIKELDKEQKAMGEEWVKARGEFQKKLSALNDEITDINVKLIDIYEELLEIRNGLWQKKNQLSQMFMSGDYEHCLGFFDPGSYLSNIPVEEAIAQGLIKSAPPGQKFFLGRIGTSPNGLPGMNIDVPPPEKKNISELKDISAPFVQVRLKMDGTEQLRRDRALIEALVVEEQAKAYAKHGTVLIWLGNTIFNTLGMGAVDAGVYDGLADPNLAWYEKIGQSFYGMGKNAFHFYEQGQKIAENALRPIVTDLYLYREIRVDLGKTSRFSEFLASIPESIGDDISHTLRAGGKALGLYEDGLEADPFEGLGDTPQENGQAVAKGIDQLRWIKEQTEEVEGTTNNLLLAIGALTTKLRALEGAGDIATAERLQKLTTLEDILKNKAGDAISDMRKKIDDISNARRMADDIEELGKTAELSPEAREWATKFNETQRRINAEVDNALENQLKKEARELQVADDLEKQKGVFQEPKKLKAEDVQDFNKKLGEGRTAEVFEKPGDKKEVLKKYDDVIPGEAEKHKIREKKGANILDEAGLEYSRITGEGDDFITREYVGPGAKIDGKISGKYDEKLKEYVMEKEYLRPDGRLKDEYQQALIEYTYECNKRGIILGDFKPDNVYFRKTPDGKLKVGMVECEGTAKIPQGDLQPGITAAEKARQIQKIQISGRLSGKLEGDLQEWAAQSVINYSETGSAGGFAKFFDQKYVDMLDNPKLLDDLAKNKNIKKIQENPGAFMKGEELKEYLKNSQTAQEGLKKAGDAQKELLDALDKQRKDLGLKPGETIEELPVETDFFDEISKYELPELPLAA